MAVGVAAAAQTIFRMTETWYIGHQTVTIRIRTDAPLARMKIRKALSTQR